MNIRFYKVAIMLCMCLAFIVQPIYAADSILLVSSDKAINDRWSKVRVQDNPALITSGSVFQDQEVKIAVLVMGPGRDTNNQARVFYDVKILAPDTTSIERKNLKAIDAKVPETNLIRISEQSLSLTFEKPGKYDIQVTVRDLTANTVQTHKQTIEVKEYSYKKFFDDYRQFVIWVNTYYQNPTPEKVIDGVVFFAHLDPATRDKSSTYMLVYFGKLFSNNPYLIPHLLKSYAAQDTDTKVFILAMLPYVKYDFNEFMSRLDNNEKRFYAEWGKRSIPYPENNIQEPVTMQDAIKASNQLDMLWSTFYASGEYRSIKQLVEVLRYGEFKGSFEKYKQTQAVADEKNAAMDLVYKAARWSIDSNVKQHKLVKDYCNYIYETETLSPVVKQELKEILGR